MMETLHVDNMMNVRSFVRRVPVVLLRRKSKRQYQELQQQQQQQHM